MVAQLSLFEASPSGLPQGFAYQPDIVSPAEETRLLTAFEALPFAHFDFHGFQGKRRVVSFGHRYDFGAERLREAEPMPDFLAPLRDRAAAFAGLAAEDIHHAMVTEYAPGAGIGWHKDKKVFGKVVGVSLGAPCTFRFRRRRADGFERAAFTAEPRSAYLLDGPARTEWEHSIPVVAALRYSVTFRTLDRGRLRM